MNIHDFYQYKSQGKKITMVTCYDYTSAMIMAHSEVDCILVGDSAAMTMHGYKDTLSANLEMMALHVAAVARGAPNKFIVGDLPFLSYRKSKNANIEAVKILMQAGAHSVKLEGADGNLNLVRFLVESGIPVMGHIGLTPQFVHLLGGYKVQGKTVAAADKLKEDALALQEAGCFAIVLECVPSELAREISQSLSIATIGIGAGVNTDGQVLVWQDLLGLNMGFKPKFVKSFLNAQLLFNDALNAFVREVRVGEFPNHEHSYGYSKLAKVAS